MRAYDAADAGATPIPANNATATSVIAMARKARERSFILPILYLPIWRFFVKRNRQHCRLMAVHELDSSYATKRHNSIVNTHTNAAVRLIQRRFRYLRAAFNIPLDRLLAHPAK